MNDQLPNVETHAAEPAGDTWESEPGVDEPGVDEPGVDEPGVDEPQPDAIAHTPGAGEETPEPPRLPPTRMQVSIALRHSDRALIAVMCDTVDVYYETIEATTMEQALTESTGVYARALRHWEERPRLPEHASATASTGAGATARSATRRPQSSRVPASAPAAPAAGQSVQTSLFG